VLRHVDSWGLDCRTGRDRFVEMYVLSRWRVILQDVRTEHKGYFLIA